MFWFRTIQIMAPHLFKDFADLIQHFCFYFGDPDIIKTSADKLKVLKQTGSCAVYASKSREYHAHLDMTDQSKSTQFYDGLKDPIKDLLVGKDKGETFDQFVRLCIDLDNDYHRRSLEHKTNKTSTYSQSTTYSMFPTSSFASAPASSPSRSSDVVPMEVDAIKRGPVSPEERARRKSEGLCFYCGQGKHSIENCPNMSPKAKAARSKARASPASGKA